MANAAVLTSSISTSDSSHGLELTKSQLLARIMSMKDGSCRGLRAASSIGDEGNGAALIKRRWINVGEDIRMSTRSSGRRNFVLGKNDQKQRNVSAQSILAGMQGILAAVIFVLSICSTKQFIRLVNFAVDQSRWQFSFCRARNHHHERNGLWWELWIRTGDAKA